MRLYRGTTGETPALSAEEFAQVVRAVVRQVQGVPVIAGTGSNSTRKPSRPSTRERTRADAALVVVPYYNKPGPTMQVAHFQSVANEVAYRLSIQCAWPNWDQYARCGHD